jgi:flagellar biosynthesis protein FlhB
MIITLPFLALVSAIAFFSTAGQTRFMWSSDALTLKFDKLNPLKGLKGLVSKRSAVEVLKALMKTSLLAYIAYSLVMKELPEILSLPHKETRLILQYLGGTLFTLTLKVGFFFLFIAGLDFMYQKWQFKKDLMMTFQEVKEEGKEREGNPQVKGKIRSLQRAMARRRMLDDVKTATVVVTNPTHLAVALKYERGLTPAPRIVAKGAGFVAEKIKAVAKDHKVPVMENKPLARALFYSTKIGDLVPEQFYMIVAELLAQVYKRRKRAAL